MHFACELRPRLRPVATRVAGRNRLVFASGGPKGRVSVAEVGQSWRKVCQNWRKVAPVGRVAKVCRPVTQLGVAAERPKN